MRNELGDVRRSQIITTHGPGAIVDFRAGSHRGAAISVVAAGLEEWDRWAPPPGLGNAQTIFEPRLQKELGVEGFRLPPVAPQVAPGTYSSSAGKLVGVRFPRWLQCPNCREIRPVRRWTEDPGDPALYCSECSERAGGRNRIHAVPVRFIVMCEMGHLDEFPWQWWVRHRESCRRPERLKLQGSGTAGLAGLNLICTECGAQRSMEGCFGEDAIPSQCHGHRPWIGDDADEPCTAKPRVVQRGASNTYFSVVESALDIPPWSGEIERKLGIRWAMLERAPDAAARQQLIRAMNLSSLTGKNDEELSELIEDRLARLNSPGRNIRWEEYQQFVQHAQAFGQSSEFEIRPSAIPPELAPWIDQIVRATRIREVRALKGFTRLFPPAPGETDRVAKISRDPMPWLPAVENRGEGVFLRLRPEKLAEWETSDSVLERLADLKQRYIRAWRQSGREGNPPQDITARMLVVHSLAHSLIRQLAITCGYASASLRERLYVGSEEWEMSGLLIFTSSPDADGTLGGLVRQGESRNIVGLLEDCLASMRWCSSDPLCIEGIQSLSTPSNGAACHACLLAPETSCETFNSLLDRAMLIGTPRRRELGFFKGCLEYIG